MNWRAVAPWKVHVLDGRAALDTLAGEWERLQEEAAASTPELNPSAPFYSPRWFAIWADTSSGTPILAIARRAGRLEAVLPLLAVDHSLAGVRCRMLQSLSDEHSPRFDLLCRSDEALEAILTHLLERPNWDVLLLRDLLPGSNGERMTQLAEARGLPTGAWPSLTSPFLSLPGEEAQLDNTLSAKFRANLRRRAKKLTTDVGPLSLERIDTEETLEAALDDGFRLEAAGWKGGRQTAIACIPRLERRYRALAHHAAKEGTLALYFLRAGSRRVAFHFGIASERVYYLLKPGFDPTLASYGLGHLLVDRVARDLIARGFRELDFLGDTMDWKADWTAQARTHRWRYIFRPTATGHLLQKWKFNWAPALKSKFKKFHRG